MSVQLPLVSGELPASARVAFLHCGPDLRPFQPRAGIPQTVAIKLTGHKADSVFRRYDIVSPDDLRVAVERLDSATTRSA